MGRVYLAGYIYPLTPPPPLGQTGVIKIAVLVILPYVPRSFFFKAAGVCTLSLLRNVHFILSDSTVSFLHKHKTQGYGALYHKDCPRL